MPIAIQLLTLIFVLSTTLFAQDISRLQEIENLKRLSGEIKQREQELDRLNYERSKITEKLLLVSEKDKAEADEIAARPIRLFPNKMLDKIIPAPDGDSFSEHRFNDNFDYYLSPTLIYRNGNLEILDEKKSENKNMGLIANIGGTLIQTIDQKNREYKALASYQPPTKAENFTGEYSFDGITFRKKASVAVGNTYLIRVISYNSVDAIYAIRVHRKDSDGSVVLFIKDVGDLLPPGFEEKRDEKSEDEVAFDANLLLKIQNILYQKGFYNITVRVEKGVVTLRGTVPKGKMGEAVFSVSEAKPKKVENQLTEEN